jgi:cobalt/nickel transport protein
MSRYRKIIIALAVIIVLTPLGIMTKNPAWGEWSQEELAAMIGFVPKGIKEGEVFKAPFSDYSFLPLGEIGGYIFSATLGSIIVISIFYALKKFASVQK